MLKVVAVDDEPIALEIIDNYIKRYENVELIESFNNPLEAFIFFKSNKDIDLIFLDINMPDISGIDFCNNLNEKRPLVVFTTAFPNYALQAFELNVLDYLLKPFSFKRFDNSIQKALQIIRTKDLKDHSKFITVKSGFDIIRLNVFEILYFEAFGNYVKVQLIKEQFLVNISLKDFLILIAEVIFVQTHRSFVVNMNFIDKISGKNIYLKNYTIPIGNNFRESLKKYY